MLEFDDMEVDQANVRDYSWITRIVVTTLRVVLPYHTRDGKQIVFLLDYMQIAS